MQKKNKKKVLAIDFGRKRIGFAISDEMKIFANALENVEASHSLDATVISIVAYIHTLQTQGKFDIEEIIIGLPLNMNGTESETSAIVKIFAEKLKAAIEIPIRLWDERLTSVQAERSMIAADFSRKKRKDFVDRISATILLQSFLDSRPQQYIEDTR